MTIREGKSIVQGQKGAHYFFTMLGLAGGLIFARGSQSTQRSKGHGGRLHEYQFMMSLSTSDIISTRDPIKGSTAL